MLVEAKVCAVLAVACVEQVLVELEEAVVVAVASVDRDSKCFNTKCKRDVSKTETSLLHF